MSSEDTRPSGGFLLEWVAWFGLDWVALLNWNRWRVWIGMTGCIGLEYAGGGARFIHCDFAEAFERQYSYLLCATSGFCRRGFDFSEKIFWASFSNSLAVVGCQPFCISHDRIFCGSSVCPCSRRILRVLSECSLSVGCSVLCDKLTLWVSANRACSRMGS